MCGFGIMRITGQRLRMRFLFFFFFVLHARVRRLQPSNLPARYALSVCVSGLRISVCLLAAPKSEIWQLPAGKSLGLVWSQWAPDLMKTPESSNRGGFSPQLCLVDKLTLTSASSALIPRKKKRKFSLLGLIWYHPPETFLQLGLIEMNLVLCNYIILSFFKKNFIPYLKDIR